MTTRKAPHLPPRSPHGEPLRRVGGTRGTLPAVRPLVLLLAAALMPPALAAPPTDTGEDTAVDCGTPFEHDTDSPDSSGTGTDHESPENTPYFESDFDAVENCQGCHPAQYDEWHGSVHAYSATNPVMWKGSANIGRTTDSPQNCIGCHAPVATLLGMLNGMEIIGELEMLPAVSRSGVSCVSCHKIYDVYNGVNQYTHCEDHYFGTIEDPEPSGYHASAYSPKHDQALFCRSCHNVENLNHLQVEYTYSEWLEANEAAGGEETAPAIQTCQDCHMPAYTGQAAVGGPERTVHHHTFVGADVALTPFPDSHRQYRAVQALMRTAADIELLPVYEGEGGTFSGVDVSVTNLNEGHDLPSGAAFDRQVWLEIFVTDAEGTVVLESGTLDANGDLKDWNSALEPEADPWITNRESIFRSYLSDELGAETFDFIGAAWSIDDDSLVAGETRWVEYDLGVDASTLALPLNVEVRLLYRPFPPFLLREHELDETLVTSVPIFPMDSATLLVETVTP